MNNDDDFKELKKDFAKQEGESWIHAYPGHPVDNEGNPISDRTTKELGVKEIAGENYERKVDKIDSLKERFGGEAEDWVKLTTPPREGIEIHGFKNLDDGTVSLNQWPVDVEERRQEMIEKHRLQQLVQPEHADQTNQDTMTNIDETEQNPTEQTAIVDSSVAESFDENKDDIFDEVKPAEPLTDDSESNTDVIDEVDPPDSVTEGFPENKDDIIDEVEPPADVKTDFSENAESLDVATESSRDALKSDFQENAEDITGSKPDTDDDPDRFNPELKPDF